MGCDLVIESSAAEDRCGVCNGDGSTCTTVRKTFAESEGLGRSPAHYIPLLQDLLPDRTGQMGRLKE